jgi:hypothetical protein
MKKNEITLLLPLFSLGINVGMVNSSSNQNFCKINSFSAFDASGTYSLSPTISYSCYFDIYSIYYTVFTFVDDGETLTITEYMNGGCQMTGPSATASAGTIDVSCTYPGGCTEYYTLLGSFTDDNTWEATFTVSFSGGSCFDCSQQSWNLVGNKYQSNT